MVAPHARTYSAMRARTEVRGIGRRPRGRSSGELRNMDTRSTQPEAGLRTGASQSIAFGLERIGIISLRFPLFVGIAAIVLLIAGAFGTARIKVDDSLSQLFR